VPDDGLRFVAGSIRADEIKPDEEYQGIRVGLDCRLENARIRLQIDIGFGDVVTPPPEEITFPAVLDFEAPVLKAYPKESVVAEKLQAMVALGIANSRMKDFYDLWFLSSNFEFNGEILGRAIEKTFKRRQTPIPLAAPIALTDEFGHDLVKVTQWNAFVRKGRLVDDTELKDIVARIWDFVGPVLGDLSENTMVHRTWNPGGPWTRG
jgi:Nucleotidyl transferase AbiEii toxin, Type IV TA system